MSFDLFVFDPTREVSPTELARAAESLLDGAVPDGFQESDRAERFVDALLKNHPNLGPDAFEGSPFAGTVAVEHPAGTWVSLVWSKVGAVAPDIVRLALAHGLGAHDPQASIAYHPRRVVAAPGDATVQSPYLFGTVPAEGPLLPQLVQRLASETTDAFCILERSDRSFMQTLHEGSGAFRLEHRLAHEGTQFRTPALVDAPTVERAIVSWAAADDRWRGLAWVPLELA